METEQSRPRIASSGGGRYGKAESSIAIEGLTTEAVKAIEGMLNGANFVAFDDNGGLVVADRLARLPDPIAEPFEAESWVHSNQVDGIVAPLVRKEWGEPGKDWGFSIIIRSLLGYGYSREGYVREARKLQTWGFECLRSRRGPDGRRYEIWYLPGLWAAEGALKEAWAGQVYRPHDTDPEDCKRYREKVVRWFCDHASFGTIDLMVQRAAMTID